MVGFIAISGSLRLVVIVNKAVLFMSLNVLDLAYRFSIIRLNWFQYGLVGCGEAKALVTVSSGDEVLIYVMHADFCEKLLNTFRLACE